MAARKPNRSQRGAQAEARRRLAERMGPAREALGAYLGAVEEVEVHRAAMAGAEDRAGVALARLAKAVGRVQAASLAGVEEAKVRSAVAKGAGKVQDRKATLCPPPVTGEDAGPPS
ncbi:MAG: hypothetical protein ACRD0J_17340 [Acidimicrobiales bacterium]